MPVAPLSGKVSELNAAEAAREALGLTVSDVARMMRPPSCARTVRQAELHGTKSFYTALRIASVTGADPKAYLPTASTISGRRKADIHISRKSRDGKARA